MPPDMLLTSGLMHLIPAFGGALAGCKAGQKRGGFGVALLYAGGFMGTLAGFFTLMALVSATVDDEKNMVNPLLFFVSIGIAILIGYAIPYLPPKRDKKDGKRHG